MVNDAVTLLKERLAKAEAKEARAEKTWEAAKSETADLRTALKVILELTGAAASTSNAPPASIGARQEAIIQLLRAGEEGAQAPADVFDAYKLTANEDINIDTFRTTIWRMKDRDFKVGQDVWYVKGDNGRYWKIPATFDTRQRHEQSRRTAAPSPNFDEIDEDVPF